MKSHDNLFLTKLTFNQSVYKNIKSLNIPSVINIQLV